jgi:hypothetical protein
VAAVLLLLAAVTLAPTGGNLLPLSELQLGAIGIALTFAIFGVQGLLSVALEGQELRPGLQPPHLTNPLSVAIGITALLLFLDALLLGYGIVTGWDTTGLGLTTATGCVLVAALLLLYKEAFLGDEAHFDDREDGIPW